MFVGGACPALAQSPSPAGPPQLIRITGAFVEPAGAGSPSSPQPYPTIDVRVGEKVRPFRVSAVESLTDAKQGVPLLRNLGGFLIFTGPKEMLDRMQKPETAGRLLKIEGRLYVKDRVLLLESAEAVTRDE
jgi:hypothetical protein